jgi:hypothetical protein
MVYYNRKIIKKTAREIIWQNGPNREKIILRNANKKWICTACKGPIYPSDYYFEYHIHILRDNKRRRGTSKHNKIVNRICVECWKEEKPSDYFKLVKE